MAATETQRLLAQSLFLSPTTPQQVREKKTSRPRLSKSHYRPFSQVVSEGFEASQAYLTGVPGRNSIALSMSFPSYSLREKGFKSKERRKERERGRDGGHLRILSSHRSSSNESKNECTSRLRHGLTSKVSLSSLSHVIDVSPHPEYEDSMVSRTEDTYLKKRVWHRYGSMMMHPYPNDAVYMQSYDPSILENEKYSYLLLRHLMPSVPTFSTSLDKPPSHVLDLGCGQGHWLLDASRHWPCAEFLGFDLVDILLPEVQKRSNVQLVRGNFLKYRLPFPNQSFDFVRMANLTIAIPHDKWSFIVAEARRVLKIGGQLEIIDDEMLFPYGTIPVVTSTTGPHSQDSLTSGTRHCSLDTTNIDSSISPPTLRGSEVDDSDCTLTDEVTTRLESRLAMAGCQRRSIAYFQQWVTNRQIAQDVERTFTGMLRKRSVHLSPKDFVPDLLKYTFGSGNVSATQTYNISLAPASFTPHPIDPASSKYQDEKPTFPDGDLDKRLEEGGPESEQDIPNRGVFSLRQSAKAAGRLGISYSDLVAATASARRLPHDVQYSTVSRTSQPFGIIIAPSSFVPLSATEIEFHTCKWMHTLLGCRPAIFDYVRSHLDEMGRGLVSDSELKEALWTYECFRRQRFHWPTDSEHDPEGFTAPCIPNTRKMDYKRLIGGCEEPVRIRTIHAYHATKTDMTSFASPLFSSSTVSVSSQ